MLSIHTKTDCFSMPNCYERRIVDYCSLCVWMEWNGKQTQQRLWFITFKLPYSPSFFTSQNFSSFHWLSYICACTPLNHDVDFSLNGAFLLAYTHIHIKFSYYSYAVDYEFYYLILIPPCHWLCLAVFLSLSLLSICVYVRFYAARDTIFH
jgi:hypothetical protein